jgi:hypothetical protein
MQCYKIGMHIKLVVNFKSTCCLKLELNYSYDDSLVCIFNTVRLSCLAWKIRVFVQYICYYEGGFTVHVRI